MRKQKCYGNLRGFCIPLKTPGTPYGEERKDTFFLKVSFFCSMICMQTYKRYSTILLQGFQSGTQ